MLGVPSNLLYFPLRTRNGVFYLTDKVEVRKKTKKLKVRISPILQLIYSSQNHLGICIYEKLNFLHHIKEKIFKANKGINVIKKLNNTLYKSLVRPNLDYGDIIYDQTNNESFCNQLETVQYNAAFVTNGSIKSLWVTKSHKLELF